MRDARALSSRLLHPRCVGFSRNKRPAAEEHLASAMSNWGGTESTYLEFWKPFFNNTSLWTQHLHQRPPTRLPVGRERDQKGHGVEREEEKRKRGSVLGVLGQKWQFKRITSKKITKLYIFMKYSAFWREPSSECKGQSAEHKEGFLDERRDAHEPQRGGLRAASSPCVSNSVREGRVSKNFQNVINKDTFSAIKKEKFILQNSREMSD